jgi:TnpA family transposase
VATRELLSPAQRQRLTELPDPMDERELARYHTLSEEDLTVIGKRRRPETKMGFAVGLCYLRFPGRPLKPGERPPHNLLEYVAAQVGEAPAAFEGYAKNRDTTRREHLAEIMRTFGFRPFDAEARRELFEFLLPVSMGTDRGTVLVEAALSEMRVRAIVSPAITTVEELCWETRRDARESVLRKLTKDLSTEVRRRLDELLEVPPGESRAPLIWLREPPSSPGPKNFQKIVDKLDFVRDLGLPPNPGEGIHNNRLSQLAREGAKTTPQHLRRFDPDHRHATLVAYLSERVATLADEALDMHDRLVSEMLGKGEKARDENFRKRGKAINEKVSLYAAIGKALISARETGQDPYAVIEDAVGWERFVQSIEEAEELALPTDFDFLEHLEGQYRRLRGYAPVLLETFEFSAAPPAESLLEAVDVLKEMNATGKRKVPDDAPTSFVKPRWERHVFDEGNIDRRFYEMSAITELKNGLKSGDVWVPGSRKYADFEDYLLPRSTWERMQENCEETLPVAINPDLDEYLAERSEELRRELTEVGRLISRGKLKDVRIEGGELRFKRAKTSVPKGMKELTQKVYDRMPRVKLTDLLVAVDSPTGFTKHFTHLKTGEPAKDVEPILAAILADGTNLGLAKMADASAASEDGRKLTFRRLAWADDWHLSEENYRKALAEIVNAHHRLPFSVHWGEGKTSSSDGQRYRAGGHKDFTSQVNARYGREPGVMFYTHVSDQYAPFYTKVINTTVRDATHVLDGLLYHESDLEIEEHYTDSEGYTDQVFGACHGLGFFFAPRIRDLKDKRLHVMDKPSRYPKLASLIGGRINVKDILQNWDEILRLISSIRLGTVSATMILGKLANYPRQNGLAKALREIGRIERTLFTLRWLQDPDLRQRVTAGLNKGEARNALARAVFFNRLGESRDRSYEDQMNRAGGLALLTAAIAFWNAAHLPVAVEELRSRGENIPEEKLSHLSPLGWEHITLTGIYHWDLTPTSSLEELLHDPLQ